jgi:thiol-disulfide isomerase/thioredoxin
MEPVIVVLALVAFATALGLLWKSQQGRVRRTTGSIDLPEGVTLGGRATLLQFSTEVCSPCRATHTVLDSLARETTDVAHVDFDLTHRPDVAARFNILQTPTTLILDSAGVVRARIGGAARRELVLAELTRIGAAA